MLSVCLSEDIIKSILPYLNSVKAIEIIRKEKNIDPEAQVRLFLYDKLSMNEKVNIRFIDTNIALVTIFYYTINKEEKILVILAEFDEGAQETITEEKIELIV